MISVIKILGIKRAIVAYAFDAIAITFLLTSILYLLVFGKVKFVEVFISMIIPTIIITIFVPKLADLHSKLYNEKEKNHSITGYDDVTGFYSRKKFLSFLRREINFSIRYKTPLCVMLVKISNYKQIKKEQGRHITTYAIKEISSKICDSFEKNDILARYADDAFAIIFPKTDINKANQTKEILKKVLEKKPIYFKEELNIKTNIKIEQLQGDDNENEDTLLNRLEGI